MERVYHSKYIISVFNAINLADSELDYGIDLWFTVILGDIFRYRLLLLFCIIFNTLMSIIFIIHNLHFILSMNGIVRHIVINHLSRFTIMFVIHSSSSHNKTSTHGTYMIYSILYLQQIV